MLPCISLPEISAYTGISLRQIQRIQSTCRRTGIPWQPRPTCNVGRPRVIKAQNIQFLQSLLARSCDVFLDEMQATLERRCHIEVSMASIWRALRRSGYTMKRVTKVAVERSIEKRAEYIARIGLNYEAEQLVFVDEAACDKRTPTRINGWSMVGTRARKRCFFIRGRRYSLLPAISLDGIMALDIVEGAFKSLTFAEFIDGLLDRMNPFPGPNSVIVMDNCAIHKSPIVLEMILERGMQYEFLPPYSPDYNPIELAFSSVRNHLRRHSERIRAAMTESQLDGDDIDVYLALHEAVFSVTPEQARAWFSHCNYI
ncbi:hypothetical protein EVG20_g11074 [Dentipellis fragilis]|uniref:Tc1-like transposase DDE domain-containing protein n=1 Tax=Dentipellis fragilis TaxID=205917 RepID=A0A4Y9XMG8_9AGAM|nr:hypothetical protein EVG20_g11074 [Dentipellis fragilis]